MGTITLHHGTGATDFDIDGPPVDAPSRNKILLNARRLLTVRKEHEALALLDAARFEILPAVNHWNDNFHVLHATVEITRYEEFRSNQKILRAPASTLAEVTSEAGGPDIRFVAVSLGLADPASWQVFICHASEDKASIAIPLSRHFTAAGITGWLAQ